jgi:hypothetical protein
MKRNPTRELSARCQRIYDELNAAAFGGALPAVTVWVVDLPFSVGCYLGRKWILVDALWARGRRRRAIEQLLLHELAHRRTHRHGRAFGRELGRLASLSTAAWVRPWAEAEAAREEKRAARARSLLRPRPLRG